MAVTHKENRLFRGVVIVVALLWSLVPVSGAHAVVVSDLYQATVPVSGQSESQLAKAHQAGLERVLVRVSGDRNVTGRDGMEAHLEDARSLLESSQMVSGDNNDDRLQMTFSARAVNRVLAETGAPVWGMNRPLTLAWIAVQDGGDRGLLVETGESSEQGWSALIRDRASVRGLPLVLPPADRASDRTLLSEVWGQFMGQISRASSGIDHDLLAVVRVIRRNGGWQASWQYRGRGIEQSGSVTADNPSALASALVDTLAGELASRYAVTGGAINTGPYLRLAVEGVRSPSDYAAIKRALSQLNPVESVGAMTVTPDRIVFRVEHTGEVAQLQQNIALDDRFRALDGDSGDRSGQEADTSPILSYRWQSAAVAPSGEADQ
ncbi:DUF2066 domain-containing protein [Marinobacter zhanjiangensis]|uniref:DUF2066 domain-containing protein n=1 Tax=Marinobacter zhanjiangensis TaxID=578215 RepID=A0ABQ3ATT7_9GAMM|nr:DUF2066 domain-containing protein [Marinobacter zhanjiangensis]GGY65106.1 hypothetical protein GCM10007071_09800 [Marinobacter zhanjiangensis]